MGRYDEVDPEDLKQHLVRIARLILRLEEDDMLLQEAARLQKVFGDLRQKLFAYEIRSAADLAPPQEGSEDEEGEREPIDPLLEESHRIVREAREREEELRDELGWGGGPAAEDEEDEGDDE